MHKQNQPLKHKKIQSFATNGIYLSSYYFWLRWKLFWIKQRYIHINICSTWVRVFKHCIENGKKGNVNILGSCLIILDRWKRGIIERPKGVCSKIIWKASKCYVRQWIYPTNMACFIFIWSTADFVLRSGSFLFLSFQTLCGGLHHSHSPLCSFCNPWNCGRVVSGKGFHLIRLQGIPKLVSVSVLHKSLPCLILFFNTWMTCWNGDAKCDHTPKRLENYNQRIKSLYVAVYPSFFSEIISKYRNQLAIRLRKASGPHFRSQ